MTFSASSIPALVATAWPVGQLPILRHSAMMVGPPARWIAPSTPPPPDSWALAALTIASACCFEISPSASSRVEVPMLIFMCWSLQPSPGECVTIPARVGCGRFDSGGPIDRHDRRSARMAPTPDDLDHMSAGSQRLDDVGRHAPLDAQLARPDAMLVECLFQMQRVEAGRLHRLLDVQAEIRHVEEHLQQCLILHVEPRGAEGQRGPLPLPPVSYTHLRAHE